MLRRAIAAAAPVALVLGVLTATPPADAHSHGADHRPRHHKKHHPVKKKHHKKKVAPRPAPTPTTLSDLTLTNATSGAVINGNQATFSGTAPTMLNGTTVTLFRTAASDGQRISVASAPVANGQFNVSGLATGMGNESWMVVDQQGYTKHVSAPVTTSVYSWLLLSNQTPVDGGTDSTGQVSIGGQTYLNSLQFGGDYWSGNPSSVTYNLGYKCISFTSAYGMDDASGNGASADFGYSLDGAATDLHSHGLGPASQANVNVSGILRLKLDTTYVAGNAPTYGDWGNAQILCNAQP